MSAWGHLQTCQARDGVSALKRTSSAASVTSAMGQQRSFPHRVDECGPHREARRRVGWSEHKRRKTFEAPRHTFSRYTGLTLTPRASQVSGRAALDGVDQI